MRIITERTVNAVCQRSQIRPFAVLLLTASLAACSSPEPISHQSVSTQAADSAVNTDSVLPAASHEALLLQNMTATVYKDPNCGCCTQWVDYAEQAGMHASVQHPDNVSLFKDRYGVPQQMRSCHTAVTDDGYVFEGHIPAKFMAQFLDNPPAKAFGLAVPSMPVGSPGMEVDDQFMPYKVFQLNKDGSTTVFAHINSPSDQL